MRFPGTAPASRRHRRTVGALAWLALAAGLLVAAPGAGAHATLNLFGQNAIAGRSGKLTITIPHGCGPTGAATTRIIARLGSSWRGAKPAAVAGWTSVVTRTASGQWRLTWTATGAGLPNDQTGDFPIAVRWPRSPGTYNTPTLQYCGTQLMAWTDAFNAAADGDLPYPAVYPVPRVRVRPAARPAPTGLAGRRR